MTGPVTFDVREANLPPWPRQSRGRVYDAGTGREVSMVRRVEFAAGWVRLDNGDVRGLATVERVAVLPDGSPDVDREAGEVRMVREARRVRFAWKV